MDQRILAFRYLSQERQCDVNLLALDDALQRLEALDPQKARIVELRYFGGLTIEETAGLMDDRIESPVGRRIGPYKVVSLLGRGGMGEVYLAEDTRLERKVALKVLPPAFTQNPELVRRFEREAKAVSALNHPNILTIYEIGQTEGLHFIATTGTSNRRMSCCGKMGSSSCWTSAWRS